MNSNQRFHAPDEVAALLGVHVRTVRRFIREGRLNAVRVGKQYRIAAQDLSDFIGLRAARTRTGAAGRRRRALVSTTIDIEAIGLDEAQRLTTLLTGVFQSPEDEESGKSLNCIYYQEQGRLRIVVNAGLEYTAAVIGLINGVVKSGKTG